VDGFAPVQAFMVLLCETMEAMSVTKSNGTMAFFMGWALLDSYFISK
jgi:hypothetical protein